MKKILIIVSCTLLLTGANGLGQSQSNLANRQFIYGGFDANAFTNIKAGYGYTFPEFLDNKGLLVYGEFSFPILLNLKDKTFDTWKIVAGASSELYRIQKFGLRTRVDLFFLRHKQVLGTFTPLGIDLQLSPACHFKKSYLGLQMRWHHAIATHITHSKYAESAFDEIYDKNGKIIQADPKDGWYGNTGSSFNIGIEWFKPLTTTLNLSLDLGLIFFSSPYTGLVDAMMIGQVPLYANLILSYKLE